tara:strand:- start:54 stop:212 length:159 start_codon:yes stop_codon:yes gene_type:complete
MPKMLDKTCCQLVYWSFIVGEGTQEPLLPAKKHKINAKKQVKRLDRTCSRLV